MLTDKDIEHIASLARIALTDTEREKFKKDLSSVLDYITVLNACRTEGIEPLIQVTGLTNAMRADEYRGDFPMTDQLFEHLVGQAPMREGRFVKVKTVLKK